MSTDPAILSASSEALPVMTAAATRTHAWKDGEPGFHDLLDMINPLQHIPVVSAIYRWLTGDVPGNVAQLAGDTLYGGPVGLAASLFGIAFKEETGKDPGAMAIALLGGSDALAAAVAAATPEQPAAMPQMADASADSGISPVVPAHPPMPLVRTPATAPLPLAGATDPAESAFLAQSAARQRGLTGARAITQPIPLKLSGPAMHLAPVRMAPTAVAAAPATPVPAATGDISPAATIPQRMLDALDKYRRLEQQRGAGIDLRQ